MTMSTRGRWARAVFLLTAAIAALPNWASAQATAPAVRDSTVAFDSIEVRIAMRDGILLRTRIFTPKGRTAELPILLTRTPYGIAGASGSFAGSYSELAAEGFIFVFQDIRGRFGSDGTFMMLRPLRDKRDPRAIDESTDTYDTIEWLLKNVPNNNGRVGMLGVSYPGWLTVMAMLDPHPALKAVSPQASPASMYLGDDFHHNGAFRLSYGFEYVTMMETSKETVPFAFDQFDTYSWYLSLGSLANADARHLSGKYPTWNNFVAHPDFDAFWQREALMQYLDRVTVPTLNVAGWWDQEDFYGPLKIYETLEPHDTKKLNYLVVGPWNHGGWRGKSGQKLGNIDFGSPTGEYYRAKIQAPFFAYYLKDKGSLTQPEATVFESGSNTWRTFDSWPPKSATTKALYFQPNGRLAFTPPKATGDSSFDSYMSDPAHPVPYRNRPIEPTYYPKGSGWYTWLLEDQRFVQGRPDVLSWETETLTDDVVVAGDVTAKLFASTTGRDADWVVKLIDVYPEKYEPNSKLGGYELMVSNDVFRGRFHTSFEKPVPLVPNAVTPFTIDLHTQSYRFRKGHRIMVQVQSTWFPIIDRNPQTWVPNIFTAVASDYKAQTHRIWRTPAQASRVEIQTVSP